MDDHDWLAARFEENRLHLRAVAYRLLGSLSDADDAVQEAWMRLCRSDAGGVANLGGWLTTVVGRICLDMLRSRESRREDPLELDGPPSAADAGPTALRSVSDLENEAVLAESVGLALLVVLRKLAPAERVAFVLHDMFDVPFDDIAPMVGRTPAAARQLASRARRRIRGGDGTDHADRAAQRAVVEAFLAALRAGDLHALLAVLDPDLVVGADAAVSRTGERTEVHGAAAWASGAVRYGKATGVGRVVLIDGALGVVMAPRGRLFRVLRMAIANGRITRLEVIGDPVTLRSLDLRIL